jgi:hypothetical protein
MHTALFGAWTAPFQKPILLVFLDFLLQLIPSSSWVFSAVPAWPLPPPTHTYSLSPLYLHTAFNQLFSGPNQVTCFLCSQLLSPDSPYRQKWLIPWLFHSFCHAWICLYQAGFSICNLISLAPAAAGFLHGLIFNPEDGGDILPLKCRGCLWTHDVTNQKIVPVQYCWHHPELYSFEFKITLIASSALPIKGDKFFKRKEMTLFFTK